MTNYDLIITHFDPFWGQFPAENNESPQREEEGPGDTTIHKLLSQLMLDVVFMLYGRWMIG